MGGLTVTVQVALTSSEGSPGLLVAVALMIAEPKVRGVTTPFASTVATDGFSDVQVIARYVAFSGKAVACSVSEKPFASSVMAVRSSTTSVAGTAFTTVTVQSARVSSEGSSGLLIAVTEMVTLPFQMGFTVPF